MKYDLKKHRQFIVHNLPVSKEQPISRMMFGCGSRDSKNRSSFINSDVDCSESEKGNITSHISFLSMLQTPNITITAREFGTESSNVHFSLVGLPTVEL